MGKGGIQVQTIPFEMGFVPKAKLSALGSRSRGGRGDVRAVYAAAGKKGGEGMIFTIDALSAGRMNAARSRGFLRGKGALA